jgi:hypothetical protein
MKKLFITTLIAVSLFTSGFASPVTEASDIAVKNFQASFPSVKSVKWVVTKDFTKAVFMNNDVSTEAFYDSNGEFIGATHAIALNDLPTFAKRAFAKKYSDYVVKEAIEFNGEQETVYFISAEDEKQSVILKFVDGTSSVFQISPKKK